ncbi:ion transporter [Gynuella sp.]|uniref:ion transporter n=1 Tax=Gynuella sp. TaxID=2969146 RepID=UPI003D0C3CB4
MIDRRRRFEKAEGLSNWRAKANEIIFGADTFAGKLFDILLIVAILISVAVVMVDSVPSLNHRYHRLWLWMEWGFTILFTIEYIVRLMSVSRPVRYAFSFYGMVDLLSVLPTYLSILIPGANSFLVLRILRVLRVFRVLRLMHYIGEAEVMSLAIRQSLRKILVFLYAVLTMVVVFGSLMYVVEGSENGFSSIPKAIYWAIVTLTTVGYGDVVPHTPLGQFIASAVMIMGYAIIAVPTGIYAAEISQVMTTRRDARGCPGCGKTGHDVNAHYCKFCGTSLDPLHHE